MPVEDRRMTLEIQCLESASHTSSLQGVGTGKLRKGGVAAKFDLCENHNELFQQIDRELVQEGWAPSYMGKLPLRL